MNPNEKLKVVLDNFDFNEILNKYNQNRKKKINLEDLKEDIEFYSNSYLLIDKYTEWKEENVPLGTTKLYGSPHLPDDIEPLEDEIFLGQFNFQQLKPFDHYNVLPADTGMCYFFVTSADGQDVGHPVGVKDSIGWGEKGHEDFMIEHGDDLRVVGKVYYTNVPTDQLKIREIPNGGGNRYSSKVFDFNKVSESIFFVNQHHFNLKEILGDNGNRFVEAMKEELGDFNFCDYDWQLPDEFFFGRPQCHQGEDDGEPVLFSTDSLSVNLSRFNDADDTDDDEFDDDEFDDDEFDDDEDGDSGRKECVFNFCLPSKLEKIELGGLHQSCT